MDDEEGVRRLIAEAERIFGQRWDEVTSWLRSRQSLETIERLVATGHGWQVLDQRDLVRAARAIGSDAAGVYREAADRVTSRIGEIIDAPARFDATNARAVQSMDAQALRFIQQITQEQRDTLRAVMSAGLARGDNPRDVARTIRDSIGLTSTQAAAVDNYRRALETGHSSALDRELRDRRSDGPVERAIAGGKPLAPEQVDRLVGRYRDSYVSLRAETIARTESLRAVHEGAEDAWNQAIDRGEVKADTLVRTWHSGKPPRTRLSHYEMDGQTVAIGEPFTSGAGNLLRYPGDPSAPAGETINCRCAVSTRMVA